MSVQTMIENRDAVIAFLNTLDRAKLTGLLGDAVQGLNAMIEEQSDHPEAIESRLLRAAELARLLAVLDRPLLAANFTNQK